MEIVSGLQRMQSPRRIQKFMNNISGEEVLPFDEAAGKLAGEIAGDLERTGQSLGIADPMIAAIALRHGLELVNALPPPKWGSFWANPAIAELHPRTRSRPVDPGGSCGFLSSPKSRTG